MYDKIPEVLIRGHALNKDRITKLEERALFYYYVILPTKFGFKLSFSITMLIIKFISRCRKGKPFNGPKLPLPLELVPKVLVQISRLQPLLMINGLISQPQTYHQPLRCEI